jgi:peptidyl-prolyl cis-trans isomerase D
LEIFSDQVRLFSQNQFEIAEIAGKSISYENFQQKFDELSEIYMLNTGESSLDAETYESILEQAWQLLLREIVLEEEYDRLGIEVSPEELFDMVQGANIHPLSVSCLPIRQPALLTGPPSFSSSGR